MITKREKLQYVYVFLTDLAALAAYERNRLSLYREAAKEAEDIIDRWEDELDDDEDYEPDEYFSD